jgi:hypothetical protein
MTGGVVPPIHWSPGDAAPCLHSWASIGTNTWKCAKCGAIKQNNTSASVGDRPCRSCGGKGGAWASVEAGLPLAYRASRGTWLMFVACVACAGTGRTGMRYRPKPSR